MNQRKDSKVENCLVRYFESSAADLVRGEFSNQPRPQLEFNFDVSNANPMTLLRMVNYQARRNQEEIRNALFQGG